MCIYQNTCFINILNGLLDWKLGAIYKFLWLSCEIQEKLSMTYWVTSLSKALYGRSQIYNIISIFKNYKKGRQDINSKMLALKIKSSLHNAATKKTSGG